jgi:hypothetical protein
VVASDKLFYWLFQHQPDRDPVAVAFSARETTLERLMAQDRVKRSLFSPDFNPWVEVLGGRSYRLAGVPHRVGEATDCSIQQAEEDEFQ